MFEFSILQPLFFRTDDNYDGKQPSIHRPLTVACPVESLPILSSSKIMLTYDAIHHFFRNLMIGLMK